MKGLPKSPIPEKRPFVRWFGIHAMEVEIFRLHHPKAQRPADREREALIMEERAAEFEKAKARIAKARLAGVGLDPDGIEKDDTADITAREALDLDEEFSDFMAKSAQAEAERQARESEDLAVRYVAAWRGKAFPARRKGGAFTDEDVRKAFFEPREEMEATTLPSFEDDATGAPVYDQERVDAGAEVIAAREKRLDELWREVRERHEKAVKERWNAENPEGTPPEKQTSKDLTDEEKAARAKEWEEVRSAEIERAAEALRELGLRECKWAGMNLREAMAAQILAYATEVEEGWRKKMGPLVGRFAPRGPFTPFRQPPM